MKRITLVAYLAAKQCLFSAEHPDMREPYPGRHQCNIGAERRVGVRLSRAPDVAGCVAIPSYSPVDSESPGFYASPPTSRTHYSAAFRVFGGAYRPP
jgi:hypothetical protein